jgi:hypothetical protein
MLPITLLLHGTVSWRTNGSCAGRIWTGFAVARTQRSSCLGRASTLQRQQFRRPSSDARRQGNPRTRASASLRTLRNSSVHRTVVRAVAALRFRTPRARSVVSKRCWSMRVTRRSLMLKTSTLVLLRTSSTVDPTSSIAACRTRPESTCASRSSKAARLALPFEPVRLPPSMPNASLRASAA